MLALLLDITTPLVVALYHRWEKILPALLVDLAEMPGSTLSAAHQEAQEDERLYARMRLTLMEMDNLSR